MREIKFRAARYDNGVLAKIHDDVTGIDYDEVYDVYNARLTNGEWLLNIIPLQSTGLKDKHGVEIYEGDIVNITQFFGGHPFGEIAHVIKRSEYNNDLIADSKEDDWRTPEVRLSYQAVKRYAVIGNKFEHPHLF